MPMTSITSPEQVKRLYLDPRMLPLIENRRVLLVDDVISSGRSIVAALKLLASCGVRPVADRRGDAADGCLAGAARSRRRRNGRTVSWASCGRRA